MPQGSYDLKLKAKEALKGYWLQAVIVCFIAWLLTSAYRENSPIYAVKNLWQNGNVSSSPPANIFDSWRNFINYVFIGQINFSNLVHFILMGPLTLGVSTFFLKLIRKEAPHVQNIFEGFQFFLKSFTLNLLITLFTTLWSLLLLIPGIIANLRYSMAYYILIDNPQLSAFEALKQSKGMMAGYKFELFVLELSFLGWFLLGAFTLGIAMLWVNPYYEAAKANFYQELKANSK